MQIDRINSQILMDAKKENSRNQGIKPRKTEDAFTTPKDEYLKKMQTKERNLSHNPQPHSEAKPSIKGENPYIQTEPDQLDKKRSESQLRKEEIRRKMQELKEKRMQNLQ